MREGLRERKKAETHQALAKAALDLADRLGPERVTVEAIADAEAEVMRFGERPRGKLRMTVGTAFGTYALVPALPEFQAPVFDVPWIH